MLVLKTRHFDRAPCKGLNQDDERVFLGDWGHGRARARFGATGWFMLVYSCNMPLLAFTDLDQVLSLLQMSSLLQTKSRLFAELL